MAKKETKPLEDAAPVEAMPEEKPVAPPAPPPTPAAKPAVSKSAKAELNAQQKAVAAIALFRQNDIYKSKNTVDAVQYRNSRGRLIVNVTKTASLDAVSKANELLAVYKDFTQANVVDAKQIDDCVVVVTTDGDKYCYDLTTNALA